MNQKTGTPQQPKIPFPNGAKLTAEQVHERFEGRVRSDPDSVDMPGFIATSSDLLQLLKYLKKGTRVKYARLEDITAINERTRRDRPPHDFTLVYHLLSLQVPGYLRVKLPLTGESPEAPTITSLWPSANWYEREVYDLFGIRFTGHPDLHRILMPNDWEGFAQPNRRSIPEAGTMILNIETLYPGTYGALCLTTKVQEGKIAKLTSDIGYNYVDVEKINAWRNWNPVIPYSDRIDSLCDGENILAYLQSVETLLGMQIPARGESIRILLCELFRIANHLAWLGNFVHGVGVTSTVFHPFDSGGKIFNLIETITGGRMHPAWFCLGGVPNDLPNGSKQVIEMFAQDLDKQLDAYTKLLTDDPIFRSRTEGVGIISSQTAVDMGVTGPILRATGIPWDVRRAIPYGGYDRYDFDVVIAEEGDCFARYRVRIGEVRESLKIIRQVVSTMPGGEWKNHFDTPNQNDDTLSRRASVPKGECYRAIESSKGECGSYVVSDGSSTPYRMRIRSPGLPHLQVIPEMTNEERLTDLSIILGSTDCLFV